MSTDFKDHFSDKSALYSTYRPVYPEGLFSYLSSLTDGHDRAWDCGTGSGQSAIALSPYYREVIATDASENQILNARTKEGVIYKVESAEKTSIDAGSVDLVTVAQALHWFNLKAFTGEVERVMRPGGVIAVWTYGLHRITEDIDAAIDQLYGPVLERFWPPERKAVEGGYKNVDFPMKALKTPMFQMEVEWDLSQLAGYLRTWSAVRRCEAETGVNPVDQIYRELCFLWGAPEMKRTIRWPLTLKVWQAARMSGAV